MGQERGSIAFFSSYRPPVQLDIFSCPITPFPFDFQESKVIPPFPNKVEHRLTDGKSYNYNGHSIPRAALRTILNRRRHKLASEVTETVDVLLGKMSGLLFVSERDKLETLQIGLEYSGKVEVLSFSHVFGTFDGVRMEDSGSIAGNYLVYVTTKDDPKKRRQPWTAVYKTHLATGKTERLTPLDTADLSPSASPSGKRVAVASFEAKGIWDGEIEDLKTDIFVMNVEGKLGRKLVIRNGGWPTWGSEDVIFFHRKVYVDDSNSYWGVFRADISSGETTQVTPNDIQAITPVAIDATTVALATIRKKSKFSDVRDVDQFRHIEIFDSTGNTPPIKITQKIHPLADHFNPFVVEGRNRIGYHRTISDLVRYEDFVEKHFHKIKSPEEDVGLFRVSGVFPTFDKDGSKLAFVDNDFQSVWIADSDGLRIVYKTDGPDHVFSPVFNQNPDLDILYICLGPSFNAKKEVNIWAIHDVSTDNQTLKQLTFDYNNAFPSSNPEGTKVVFRSTRDGGSNLYKNLYIIDDADEGDNTDEDDNGDGTPTRLTTGNWVDTHCEWSPSGDWIVFSSTRDKPNDAIALDQGLDLGYFAVYLVKWDDPHVVVRVFGSGRDFLPGHVNHPFFSPDGKSIVVTADLAAVSADPMSMPLFLHSVRPYGDIFTVDIDPDDIYKNEDVQNFTRITHSRYENTTASWTRFSTDDPNAAWNTDISPASYMPGCPYMREDGGEGWPMTGHLMIPNRLC